MSAAAMALGYDANFVAKYPKKQSDEEMKTVSDLITEFQYLYGLRGNWNSHWTEIAQRILPNDSWLFQNYQQLTQQGDKRTFEVYDSTGLIALQRFGAILDSLLTPSDNYWHQLRASDDKLMKDKATRLWFDEANKTLFKWRYAPKANFQSQNQMQYVSLGAYGTGAMFIDELYGAKGIRYRNVHLGELYLQENHQRVIDRVCRHFMLTARQAYQQFGDKCPDVILSTMEAFPERQFFFIHWCMPRKDKDPMRKDFMGMDYASYYISIEGHAIVDERGYRSFPYAISRYWQASNETYGRAPAMDALPSIKTLNEQKKAMLKQGHRALDPVLLAHDDGIIDGFDLTPGVVNAGGVTADGRLLVQSLPVGNIQAGKEMMDEEKSLINDTFLVSLFQILTENPEMTATEVMERTREKGILLAPTVGRQQSEYISPMVERELDILSRQGLLPPQPRMLRSARGEYKVVHDSPISRLRKADEASGTMRWFETLTNAAQNLQDPSIADYCDWDVAAPDLADTWNVPLKYVKSPQAIMKIRQQRAQQQQTQTAIQAAPAVAGMMKAAPQRKGPAQ